MFGFGKLQPVAEHEAAGEIERVYHEIKKVLRVTGVNLNFRTWAGYQSFLPAMWNAMRRNAETRHFEDAADRVRAEAAHAAEALGRLSAIDAVQLGESQTYQLRAALDLYHYINPKLLVLTSAVKLALDNGTVERSKTAHTETDSVDLGSPDKMYSMEMEDENPSDGRIANIFKDIKETLSLSSVNSDYRTLALWPDYLEAAWQRLKPVVRSIAYQNAVSQVRETAVASALSLPYPVSLSRQTIEESGDDFDAVVKTTAQFEELLPGLILNIALCEHDWRTGDDLARSPFPATPRPVRGGAA